MTSKGKDIPGSKSVKDLDVGQERKREGWSRGRQGVSSL